MTPAATDRATQFGLSKATSAAPFREVASPLLSIVIVNYRCWRETALMIEPLLASESVRAGRAEIIVIDNAARPSKWRRQLRKQFGVSVRAFRKNRGFGQGVNEGCRLSRGEWLLLLNPDSSLPAGFLDDAMAAAGRWSQLPRAGVIGCRLLDPGGNIQGSAGQPPTLLRLLSGLLRPRATRKCRPLQVSTPVEVPWVTGCGMLLRRDCIEELGGFDPAYFLYYEDADLCRRARAAGWSVWHDPALSFVHHRPLHSRRVPAHLRLMTRHALLTYAAKHWPAWQFRTVCRLASLEANARAWWARRHKQRHKAKTYSLQAVVANDVRGGHWDMAFRRIWNVAQQQGRRHERPRKPR